MLRPHRTECSRGVAHAGEALPVAPRRAALALATGLSGRRGRLLTSARRRPIKAPALGKSRLSSPRIAARLYSTSGVVVPPCLTRYPARGTAQAVPIAQFRSWRQVDQDPRRRAISRATKSATPRTDPKGSLPSISHRDYADFVPDDRNGGPLRASRLSQVYTAPLRERSRADRGPRGPKKPAPPAPKIDSARAAACFWSCTFRPPPLRRGEAVGAIRAGPPGHAWDRRLEASVTPHPPARSLAPRGGAAGEDADATEAASLTRRSAPDESARRRRHRPLPRRASSGAAGQPRQLARSPRARSRCPPAVGRGRVQLDRIGAATTSPVRRAKTTLECRAGSEPAASTLMPRPPRDADPGSLRARRHRAREHERRHAWYVIPETTESPCL